MRCAVSLLCFGGFLLLASAPPVRAAEGWEWTRAGGWDRSEAPAKNTAEEQFAYAQELEASGDHYDAARQYLLLVRTFPDSKQASQAITRLAEVLFHLENYYASFKALEESIEKYPRSIHLPSLLEIEYHIGQRLLKGAPVSLVEDRDPRTASLEAAIEVFEAITKHDEFGRYGPYTERAYCDMGQAYLELNRPSKAKDVLSVFLNKFPKSRLALLAQYRIELAKVQLGYGSLDRADKILQQLQQEAEATRETGAGVSPNEVEDSVRSLREREAENMLQAGRFYERRGNPRGYDSALFTYRQILERYPNTSAAERAKARISALESGGRPDTPIGEREFSLPGPLDRIKIPRLVWSPIGEGPELDRETEAGEPRPAEADGEPPGEGEAPAVAETSGSSVWDRLQFWRGEESSPAASADAAPAEGASAEPQTGEGDSSFLNRLFFWRGEEDEAAAPAEPPAAASAPTRDRAPEAIGRTPAPASAPPPVTDLPEPPAPSSGAAAPEPPAPPAEAPSAPERGQAPAPSTAWRLRFWPKGEAPPARAPSRPAPTSEPEEPIAATERATAPPAEEPSTPAPEEPDEGPSFLDRLKFWRDEGEAAEGPPAVETETAETAQDESVRERLRFWDREPAPGDRAETPLERPTEPKATAPITTPPVTELAPTERARWRWEPDSAAAPSDSEAEARPSEPPAPAPLPPLPGEGSGSEHAATERSTKPEAPGTSPSGSESSGAGGWTWEEEFQAD